MFPSLRPARQSRLLLPLLTLAAAADLAFAGGFARAQSLFSAEEVAQERFVLVAAPIGSTNRYQLNIYEQVNDRRPCFAVDAGQPAAVNPLLASFDFTGICSRYIDANGYSVRVGGTDLATSYRLLVRNEPSGTLLVALPTKAGAGPEMVVARAGGAISGFHKLNPEPGWRLMRRQYGGRRLGHLYLYSETWPEAAAAAAGSGGAAAAAAVSGAAAAPAVSGTASPAASVSAPGSAPTAGAGTTATPNATAAPNATTAPSATAVSPAAASAPAASSAAAAPALPSGSAVAPPPAPPSL